MQTASASPNANRRPKSTLPILRLQGCKPSLSSNYIVKGLFHRNCVSIVWGETGCRKTFALLDGAAAIASGQPTWHGRRIRAGRVVYICAEGGEDDARNRLSAIKHARNIERADLALIPVPIAIDEDSALKALCDAIHAAFGEPKADLLIFDTVSVCLRSTDEYHNGEVARMMARLRVLMRRLGGAHTVLVHHTGHSFNRERGAYAWRANADVSIEIAFDDRRNCGLITAHKVRHGVIGAIGAFTCQEKDLGVDDDGDRVASLAAIECAAPSRSAEPAPPLTIVQAEILEEIDIGLAQSGRRLRPDPDMDEQCVLDRSVLNQRLRHAGVVGDVGETDTSLSTADRSRIRDNLDALRAKGLIGRNAKFVWRISTIGRAGTVNGEADAADPGLTASRAIENDEPRRNGQNG